MVAFRAALLYIPEHHDSFIYSVEEFRFSVAAASVGALERVVAGVVDGGAGMQCCRPFGFSPFRLPRPSHEYDCSKPLDETGLSR